MPLCIGGPNHGENIEIKGPTFYALRKRKQPLMPCDTIPEPTVRDEVMYERRFLMSDGDAIPIWIIP